MMVGTLASMSAAPTFAQTVANGAMVAGPSANDASTPFTGDDLLFMEVTADGYQLAETMNVYASRRGVYIPLGEFARVLDFAVGVFPAQRRAEGWILSRDNSLVLDLSTGRARVGGVDIAFDPDQISVFDDDFYVRTDLLERLIPVRLTPDVNAQTLVVVPTQPLPFQQRLAREQRRAGAVSGKPTDRFRTLPSPYLLASPPAFDINLGGQVTRDGDDQSRSYDVRMAGDLLWAGFQGLRRLRRRRRTEQRPRPAGTQGSGRSRPGRPWRHPGRNRRRLHAVDVDGRRQFRRARRILHFRPAGIVGSGDPAEPARRAAAG